MSATLAQRLALVKYLGDALAKVRKDDLLPEATADMEPGERHAVKFGGRLAGWASMPKPAKTVTVTDEDALTAWAEANAPDRIMAVDEVAVGPELIEYLAEQAPQFLRRTRRPDPQWVADLSAGLKDRGYYATYQGDKFTDIPGVKVSESTPSPRVTLEEDAAAVIGSAWADGQIDLSGLLALKPGSAA